MNILIFKYQIKYLSEHFQKIEHNLLGQSGAKLTDIKEVYSHAQGFISMFKIYKNNNLMNMLELTQLDLQK